MRPCLARGPLSDVRLIRDFCTPVTSQYLTAVTYTIAGIPKRSFACWLIAGQRSYHRESSIITYVRSGNLYL